MNEIALMCYDFNVPLIGSWIFQEIKKIVNLLELKLNELLNLISSFWKLAGMVMEAANIPKVIIVFIVTVTDRVTRFWNKKSGM